MVRRVMGMIIFACLVILLLGGCSTKNVGTQEAPSGLTASAAPVPDSVDPGIWAMLTTELARVVSEMGKTASTPPLGITNAIDNLMLNDNGDGTNTLTWTHFMTGDTDQNGEVNIGDLTPIGMHYNKNNTSADWVQAQIADTDQNGQVNINDVTPIGQHFMEKVHLYGVFANPDNTAYPVTPSGANGAGTRDCAEVAFTQGVADANGLKVFTYTDTAPVAGDNYWVRGCDSDGNTGKASNIAQPGVVMNLIFELDPATPANSGSGSDIEPYMLTTGNSYSVRTRDQISPTPLTDQTTFTTSNAATVSVNASGEIQISLGFDSPFSITASITGQVFSRDTLYFDFDPVTANQDPIAAFDINNASGTAPLHVYFNASASSDPDAGDSITLYEWDFEDDGLIDYSSTTPTAKYTYIDVGVHRPVLRVTDNHGATGTDMTEIAVTSGFTWTPDWINTRGKHVCIWKNGENNPCIASVSPNGIDFMYGDDPDGGTFTKVNDIAPSLGISSFKNVTVRKNYESLSNIVPAIAYIAEDSIDGVNVVMYMKALDADGATWAAPVQVAYDVAAGALGMEAVMDYVHVFFIDADNNLTVMTSVDNGATFTGGVALDTNGDVAGSISTTSADSLVVAYSTGDVIKIRTSTDSSGASWNIPVVIASDGVYEAFDVDLINGYLGIAYVNSIDQVSFNSPAYFAMSRNLEGTDWRTAFQVGDTKWGVAREITLSIVTGTPAIAYADDEWTSYYRSHDEFGTYWSEQQFICSGNNHCIDMVQSLTGRPQIAIGQDAGSVAYVTY